jgi:hypothetical protein
MRGTTDVILGFGMVLLKFRRFNLEAAENGRRGCG